MWYRISGETHVWQRNTYLLRSQHQKYSRNGKNTNCFHTHLDKIKGQEVDWENVLFRDSESFWKGIKVKESLYISAQNPSKVLDAKVILNLEMGWN